MNGPTVSEPLTAPLEAPLEALEVSAQGIPTGLIGWILGGVFIAGLLWLGGRVMQILPLSKSRRTLVARLGPVTSASTVGIYLFVAMTSLLRDSGGYIPLATICFSFVTLAALWGPFRDFAGGVLFRAGGGINVGDQIRVGEIQGRVENMGYRVLTVATPSGDEFMIPYTNLSRESIVRLSEIGRVAPHRFVVEVEQERSDAWRVQESRICDAAAHCHWSSLTQLPVVVRLDNTTVEVTVFSIAKNRASDIELEVRRALTRG